MVHTCPSGLMFFESTVAKQIALIEGELKDPILHLGNLDSIRTFQDFVEMQLELITC